MNDNSISLKMDLESPNPVDITTAPFPEFPTDMQAQFSVINAISNGTANIYETVFENRFMHILELNRMGCDIVVKGNHAFIKGVKFNIWCSSNGNRLKSISKLNSCRSMCKW
jgi:UDP-N-acetylglucosamine 1-carboxyvinyltransferase